MRPGLRLLDLGSGCGHKLQLWHEWFGVSGIGLDLMADHVKKANALFQLNGPAPLRSCVGSITKLAWLPSDYFDLVFSRGVIMYLPDKEMVAGMCFTSVSACSSPGAPPSSRTTFDISRAKIGRNASRPGGIGRTWAGRLTSLSLRRTRGACMQAVIRRRFLSRSRAAAEI